MALSGTVSEKNGDFSRKLKPLVEGKGKCKIHHTPLRERRRVLISLS